MPVQSAVQRPSRAREGASVKQRSTASVGRAALGSPLLLAGVGCVALAAISAAALPTVPSYDPWAWIVWGKEVSDPHLAFVIGGGPSWKPLPVVFTTIFGLFGGVAPALWMIVARAGGLLGLVAGYRLARRLAGAGPWGAAAGVIAAAGIVLTQDWGYYMFRGTSEPLLIGASLWAIDRHLARRYGSAFVLAVATGLMRPEAWPFIAVYAVWLWIREPRLRPLVLAGGASIPLLWFVPPWISSGQPFLAAVHAQEYNGHLGSDPFLEVLRRGANLQVAPALVGAILAVALGRDRLTLSLAALVIGWWAVVVAMTLDGYPGLERFFLPAAAATCVLAGVGIVRCARAVSLPALASVALAVAIVGAAVPFATSRASALRAQEPLAARAVTRLDQLTAAVVAVGGGAAAYPCHSSFTAVNHSVQTALAWKLDVTLGRVGTSMRHQGLMFVGPHDSIDGIAPSIDPRLTQRALVARAGAWRIYRMTAPGSDRRCVGR